MRRVNAVIRAFEILDLVAERPKGVTISAVSRRLHLPKSSVYLLMRTLNGIGYLREQNRRFTLGLRLLEFSKVILDNLDVREVARSHIRQLVQVSHCSARLSVLDSGHIVVIDKEDAPGPVNVTSWIGRRLDLHCSASGKILLAFSSDERIAAALEGPLARRTSRSITDPRALRTELRRVRRLGYATNDGETSVHVRAVAAPIFGHNGEVLAALSVAGTLSQIRVATIPTVALAVRRAASDISRELRYDPQSPPSA